MPRRAWSSPTSSSFAPARLHFPSPYKEPLLEFPRELHDPGSIAQDDDKELCKQEERRLFYVAMTRARDSLTIYAKQGSGKDPSPPGFLRDLLKDSSLLGRWLVPGQPRGFQTDMFAEAAGAAGMTRASEWLNLPPASDLSTKLSASAVQTYETCPLQFKLEREWKIPGEVPAAMQYGGVIHRVLLAFYNSVRELASDDGRSRAPVLSRRTRRRRHSGSLPA